MRGPLVLVATVALGGIVWLGMSRARTPAPDQPAAPEAAAPAPAATLAAVDPSLPPVRVFKSPTCGCCTDWVAHLRENGFAVEVVDTDDLATVKAALGIPAPMGSCHTAEIGDYVVEGHVPAGDIKTLLADAPDGVRGLAVPGMPVGSPGMEVPGQAADPYDVVALGDDGSTSVFRSYR